MKIFFQIVIVKLFLLIVIAYFAPHFLPFRGYFGNPDLLTQYHLPKAIYSLANFDGAHYIHIALQGYHQFDQAFFPGYPLLIWLLAPIFLGNLLITGLVIANLSWTAGLYFFYKTILKVYGQKTAVWTTTFLVSFPTAFFFQTMYTEGLFFLLVAMSFYSLVNQKAKIFYLVSAVASFTRLVGIFLFLPAAVNFFVSKKKTWKNKLTVVTPFVGLLVYMAYLWIKFKNPFYFFTSQESFAVGRSTHLVLLPQVYYRYLKIFMTARPDFIYFVSALEIVTFTVILMLSLLFFWRSYQKKDQFGVGISLFSLSNLLLPTLTGTLLSTPRFALFAFAAFLYLAQLQNRLWRYLIVGIFITLQVTLFTLFIQGYFIS